MTVINAAKAIKIRQEKRVKEDFITSTILKDTQIWNFWGVVSYLVV